MLYIHTYTRTHIETSRFYDPDPIASVTEAVAESRRRTATTHGCRNACAAPVTEHKSYVVGRGKVCTCYTHGEVVVRSLSHRGYSRKEGRRTVLQCACRS